MIFKRLIGPLLLGALSLTGCVAHEAVVVARPAPYYYDSYYYGPGYCYPGTVIVAGGGYYRPYRPYYYGRYR